jgi:hypothetical protein
MGANVRESQRLYVMCQRLALALCGVVALLLASCAPHAGSDEIAFLRHGQLWTIYSDGTAATALVKGGVSAFAWSPDHHQIVLRYGAISSTTSSLGAAPDAVSNLGVTGVDGGAVVQITPQISGMARSDAWWNANGNRLVYREGFPLGPGVEATAVVYQLSQADQPAGIARKPVLDAAIVPAVAPDGAQVAVVDAQGNVRLGKAGSSGTIIATGALETLPGTTRPARILWRPGHAELLYAAQPDAAGKVPLVLSDLTGRKRTVLAVAGLAGYAFAPDGNALLLQTSGRLQVISLGSGGRAPGSELFGWGEADPTVLAWWSPVGYQVLVRDRSGLVLADIRARRLTPLLATHASALLPADAASWHPLAGSPWSLDGAAIVFSDDGTGIWRDHALPSAAGGGLYVGQITVPATAPALIDTGDDQAPSWSYLDPSASWLVPS